MSKCVCERSGSVLVVAGYRQFLGGCGEWIPEGRPVAVACCCQFGDELNCKRREGVKFPVYDSREMSLWAMLEAPKPVISAKPVADWGAMLDSELSSQFDYTQGGESEL